MRKNYYDILGVSRGSSKEDISATHKALAKKYHPDINRSKDAHEKMTMLNEANEVLSDASKREEYDTALNRDYRQRYEREISHSQTISAKRTYGTRDAEARAEKAEMMRKKAEERLKKVDAAQMRRANQAKRKSEDTFQKRKDLRAEINRQQVLNVLSDVVMNDNAQRNQKIKIDEERHKATEVLLSLVRKDDNHLRRAAEEAERKQRIEDILTLVKEYNEEADKDRTIM